MMLRTPQGKLMLIRMKDYSTRLFDDTAKTLGPPRASTHHRKIRRPFLLWEIEITFVQVLQLIFSDSNLAKKGCVNQK